MKRRVISLILCLTLLACLFMQANAAGGAAFLRGGYEIEDWNLWLWGRALPSGGALTVSADSQTLDASLMTVGEAGTPVTVYCLVDASTSMNEEQRTQQQDILANIGSRLRSNDNMVIATFDEKMVEGGITGDANVINTTAQTIGRSIWTKNLYQAVVQAMNSLETSTQFHKDKLLLILSDGNDCGKTDVTEAKAIAAIEKTTVPVYSIAITGRYMSADVTANVKHLQRLSGASMGGMCLIPAEEKISAANAAEKVWQNIQAGTVILVDLESIQDTGRDFTIRVQYETSSERAEDTVTVYAADLPEKSVPPLETVPIIETQMPEEELQQPERDSLPMWVWMAVGAAVIVIIAAVAAVSRRKGKKTPPEVLPPEAVSVDLSDPVPESADNIAASDDGEATMPIFDTWEPSAEETTQPIKPADGCELDFVALMHPDVHFRFELMPHVPVTFGRDKRSRFVFNGSDARLSGVHFEAEWDEKNLYIRDKSSTNGTKVNGGSCRPESWIKVENGSVLSVGGYDYRVSISAIKI